MNALSRTARWALLVAAIVVIGACLFFLRRMRDAETADGLVYLLRAEAIGASLAGWYITQSLIGSRKTDDGWIADGIHELTAPLHRRIQARPRLVNAILIASSACIDFFGIFLIAASIFGPSVRPFVALLILFLMRQLCQAACPLPAPRGMIWHDPGFPSLLVTYDVANDFFFSGHTAIAVLGAVEIAHLAPGWLGIVAAVIAFLEASVVLVLRAHYTMDVFAAVAAAYFAIGMADWIFATL
jgi:hypothetical protein